MTEKDERLFATYGQAHDAGAYELAHRWADVSRHPTPKIGSDGAGVLVPSTAATELDQVATMAALAGWLRSWLPINIHRALLAGATVAEVAAASGLDPFEVSVRWREWSDGQRHLHEQIPSVPVALDEFDRVAEILVWDHLMPIIAPDGEEPS